MIICMSLDNTLILHNTDYNYYELRINDIINRLHIDVISQDDSYIEFGASKDVLYDFLFELSTIADLIVR